MSKRFSQVHYIMANRQSQPLHGRAIERNIIVAFIDRIVSVFGGVTAIVLDKVIIYYYNNGNIFRRKFDMRLKIKPLHCLYFIITAVLLCITMTGLFYRTGGSRYEYVNQYGDTVCIWGNGLYAADSVFKATGFMGTDLTFLIIVSPMLIVFVIIDIVKDNRLSKYMLCAVNCALLYYSATLAFGVAYNFLHLLYIAFFSLCLFAFIFSIRQAIPGNSMPDIKLPYKIAYAFLIVAGISLFVAWLPDIISALSQNRPISLIENYTTEITYVLDMGIISPLCIVTLVMLYKRKAVAYPLLIMIFTVCGIVGIMVCLQTVFQLNAGIEIPMSELITKVGIFVALAICSITLSVLFLVRLCKTPIEHVAE